MHKHSNRMVILLFIAMGLILLGLDYCFVFQDNGSGQIKLSQTLESSQMEKVNDIQFTFEGTTLKIDAPIYLYANRFFIPLENVMSQLQGSYNKNGNSITIILGKSNVNLDILKNSYSSGNQVFLLKKNAFYSDGMTYVSLFDFSRILDLKVSWDSPNKVVSFFENREEVKAKAPIVNPTKPALIRLEDFIAGYRYTTDENLEKMRIVVDYLYNNGIPFSVAWIPRYVDPLKGLDVDIAKQNSLFNANFVYTLDYITAKNGTIGLHGYTHQYGNTRSGSGAEFPGSPNYNVPNKPKYVQERLENAIESAHRLDIDYTFFEAPHYIIKPEYLHMVEKRFDIIYQGNAKKVIKKRNGNHITWYIGAYLEFIPSEEDADISHLRKRLDNLEDGVLASFFFHPCFDFDDIVITKDSKGYPAYTYSEDSPLHQIVRDFSERGYVFVSLEEMKNR
ncbi:MAG: DUF2334 domain-containing protein [Peptococcaceae bacterium]|nr:DUF2334 domain-containing protein [Peptococcaceae bacterium]